MTIAAFNRIRVEEGEGASADWLGTGLCYAALAGANPALAELPSKEDPELPAIMPPTLTITPRVARTFVLPIYRSLPSPCNGRMVFDARGKLVKASHSPANIIGSGKRVVGEVNPEEAKP